MKLIPGSITPEDWAEIVTQLGDDTVAAKNIEWWHSYCSDVATDHESYNDTDFVAIGVSYKKNNHWFVVHAGNDTSGWGCHGDYAWVTYHKTYEDAVTNGLTKESRGWLGLELEGE